MPTVKITRPGSPDHSAEVPLRVMHLIEALMRNKKLLAEPCAGEVVLRFPELAQSSDGIKASVRLDFRT